ncbi:MAG: TIR domain-containing protein [Chloroflexota bacterium]
MPHLFLSYAHTDKERVFPFHAELENISGHYIWIDKEELSGGIEWEHSIQLGIKDSYGVIFTITESFFTRPFILHKEIPWALDRFKEALENRERRVFLVMLDHVSVETLETLPDADRDQALAMYEAVNKFQYIDGTDGNFARVAAQLKPLLPDPVAGGHQFIVNWPRLATFQGRGTLLKTLHERLKRQGGKVSVHAGIYGMGGVGKTQLAVEYAHRYRFHYPAGVYWVNGARDWKQEIADIGDRLQLAPADSNAPDRAGQMAAAFNGYLREQSGNALVVVDNVENPADTARREIGPAGLKLTELSARLLITTRRADLPQDFAALSVATLNDEPEAAYAILQEARPTETDRVGLEDICRTLGYLPLALGLAAAALKKRPTLTPAKFLQHLREKGIDSVAQTVKLQHGDLNVPDYYDFSLRVMLDWHWDQLQSDDARSMIGLAAAYSEAAVIPLTRLRLLANLPDDPDSLDQPFAEALDELRRANLVEDAGESGLRLHTLVREYIRTKIPDYADRLGEGAWFLVSAYREPDILVQEVAARGFGALLADLRETRATLIADAPVLPALLPLLQLERLFDWEAYHLNQPSLLAWLTVEERNSEAWWQAESIYLIQHIRERAHHQSDDALRDACDEWLAAHADYYFRTEDAYRFPNDPALVRVFAGHTAWITAVAISADGRFALSASNDKSLRLWDVSAGVELRYFEGHKKAILAATLTPDGKYALSADSTLHLWDTATGSELWRVEGRILSMEVFALATDGRILLTGERNGLLRQWDIATGAELGHWEGHKNSVTSIVIADDGRLALTGSRDRTLRLWDIESGAELRRFESQQSWVNAVALTPDGRFALSGAEDGSLILWDTTTGAEIRRFEGHHDAVLAVALTADGRFAVSAGRDITLRLWDTATGQEIRRFKAHTGGIESLAVTANGRFVVTGARDKSLRLWDLQTGTKMPPVEGHNGPVHALAVTADGRFGLSAGRDTRLRLWDVGAGKVVKRLEGHTKRVNAVALTREGRFAFSGAEDDTLRMWDVASGQEIRQFVGHNGPVCTLAVTRDGRLLLTGGRDKTIRLWDVTSGQEIRQFVAHEGVVRVVVLTSDERYALSGGPDKNLRMWDLETGEEVRPFKRHNGGITALSLTADDHFALSGAEERSVRLWDITTGQEVQRFKGHTDGVSTAAITPDGRYAFSGSWDGTLRVWEVATTRLLAVLRLEARPLALCFLPGEPLRLFMADNAGKVRTLQVIMRQ